MRVLILSLLISLQETFGYNSLLRQSFRCYTRDTACVTTLTKFLDSNFIEAIPGISKWTLDPVDVDYVKLEEDGLKLEIKDSKVIGLKNWVLDKFSPHTNISAGRALFRTDVLVNGLYKIDGSLLFIPITGTGDYSVLFKNMELEVVAPQLILNKANGEDCVETTDYNFKYNVKEDAQFTINDHYYGNTVFGDFINYFANNYNWKFVTSDFGKVFIEKIYDDIARTYRNYK